MFEDFNETRLVFAQMEDEIIENYIKENPQTA